MNIYLLSPKDVPVSKHWNPMVPELSVTDFEKSFLFYTELLGFSVRIRRHEPEFAYLAQGQVQMMIEQIHDKAWIVSALEQPLGRGINFQIELPDVMPVYLRLKKAQVRLFRELEEAWYDTGDVLSGQKEFLVQDPDGYLLRFSQHLGEKSKS